jgi:hypothetical protein
VRGSPVRRGHFCLKNYILLTAIAIGALLVHGYHPMVEDAEIYVPAIKKILDPTLYPSNAQFFIGQTRLSLFPQLIALSVRLSHLPVEWVLFLGQFISILLLLWGCWRIGRRCFPEPGAAWCGVGLIAAMLTLPVAGTALYLMDQYLTPRALAAAAVVGGIASMLEGKKRLAVAWVLFGLAMHPLMGVFAVGYLVLLACCERMWPLGARVQVAFLVLLLPPASAAYREAVTTRSYLFLSQWEWYEWLGMVAPLGLLGWFMRTGRRHNLGTLERMSHALLVYGAIFGIAGVLITIPRFLIRLVEFQPMRSLHLLYLLLLVLGGGLLAQFVLKDRPWRWVLLFAPLCAGMFFAQRQLFPASSHVEWPGGESRNDWVKGFGWIRQHTPASAYFALNPEYMSLPGEDEHGFRAIAERSRLADSGKDPGAVTIAPTIAGEWHEQVHALDGWNNFQAGDFRRLNQRFGVDWVVLQQPGVPGMECPYRNAAVLVCRIATVSLTPESK